MKKRDKDYRDVKEKMATLLIQHNLLGSKWGEFHKDLNTLVDKYWKVYEKGMNEWFENDKINSNI